MSLKVFDELEDVKKIINNIEEKTRNELKSQQERTDRLEGIDNKIETILVEAADKIIFINIGGKVFNAKLSTLVSIKDSIFYHLLVQHEGLLLNSKEKPLFIDRDFTYFPVILDYLKYGKYKIPNEKLYSEYMEEFRFYNLLNVYEKKSNETEKKIVDFNFTCLNIIRSIPSVEELKANKEKVGIACRENSEILFTFDSIYHIQKILARGIIDNDWDEKSGRNAQIYSSGNGDTWTKVGKIPKNFGKVNVIIPLSRNNSKYIKISTNYISRLGIGFIEFYAEN
jgi:hypothetical protein